MGNNKPTSTVVVQEVFEMSVAGDSLRKIGLFFYRSRRWARNILTNYSPESFSPIVIEKHDPERKTTEEGDKIIVKKEREKFCAPVRAVLAELNSPIKQKISRQTEDRRFREVGARTVKAVKDQLTDA